MNHLRKPYEPTARFKANRPFTMNAVDYNYEDAVDVRGIDDRRLRQMYDHRMIEVDDREPGSIPQPTARAKKPTAAPSSDAPKAKLKYKGFTKYDVVSASGEVLAAGLSKEDAQAALAAI
ncbi:hypothetical protein UFOVP36_65 [uncultured Caudovirales phage]|uniref:Uncharacterized protein n=1 Tax=uncultured Caudovirales phage TaxID=2100421 RepID=A0A6J5KK51_9CAUD|nr:hypothetical protein UFOVP36_65 [uncultured Caudovirales phage]